MRQETVRRRPGGLWIASILVLAVATTGLAAEGSSNTVQAKKAARARWVAGWGKPITGGTTTPSNSTVRNIARMTIGGTAVRIRVSNAFGEIPLVVGEAYIGLRQGQDGPAVVPGSTKQITFDGKPGVTVPAGKAFLYSDPVKFEVAPQQDVAVSLFLPEAENPPAATAAWNTSYAAPPGTGNQAADETGAPFTEPIVGGLGAGTYALTGIDVLTTEADGAVVGLGSSSFHGFDTPPDSYTDVLQLLSVRINNLPKGTQKGIVNAGIGGDSLHAALNERLYRDVFSHTNVTGVIVYDINDISNGRTANQVAKDYLILIRKAHARGIKVYCPTWPPRGGSAMAAQQIERHKLNGWIRNSGICDGTVDWDAVLRWEAGDPNLYHPDYFADSIHPNATGHRAMAHSVPLGWFTKGWRFPPPPPS